jgi:cell wall-associated NlpC family hydrolase
MPRIVGIVRRGAVPVLPAADGAAPPDLVPAESAPAALPTPVIQVSARLGRMLAPSTDAFRQPDPRAAWVARLKQGQQVAIVSQWQGWYAVVMGDGTQAYVPQTHVEVLPYEVKTVATAPAPAPTPPPAPVPSSAVPLDGAASWAQSASSPVARAVIQEAFRYEGVPYVYGGNTESGIDCSGLVRNCFAAHGVQLPRRASQQAQVGEPVSLDQLQPGDRLYFSVKKESDHTGIYLGNGYFIHAGRSRGKVGVDHLSTPLYGSNLTAARRL